MSSYRTTASEDRRTSHAKVNTGVFWDVVDFPIPESDPDLIVNQIRSDLDQYNQIRSDLDQYKGTGPVSIRLYGDERSNLQTKQEWIDKCEAAGISINLVPEVAEAHGYARAHKMLEDILFWALESPPESNLILLSKNMNESRTVNMLQCLHIRGCNFLSADPFEGIFFSESSAWLWDSLCRTLSSDGGGSSQ